GGWGGACSGADPIADPPSCTVTATGAVEVSASFQKHVTLDKVCTDPNWCWNNPLPQGNNIARVWGSGASDVWAVGDMGVILHWNGSGWSQVPSGTTKYLRCIWGRSSNDVWAVGDE